MGHMPIVDDIQNSAKGQEGVPCDVEVYRKPRTKAVRGYVRVELEEGDQVTYSFELGPWTCALLLTSVECITCSSHMVKLVMLTMCWVLLLLQCNLSSCCNWSVLGRFPDQRQGVGTHTCMKLPLLLFLLPDGLW